MICPHCSADLEGNAEDYVLPKGICEEECTECYEIFWTEMSKEGMVMVSESE